MSSGGTTVTIIGFDVPLNARLYKLAYACKLAGISYTIRGLEVDVDNCTDDYYRNIHPMGRTPAIQTEDGYISESNACLRAIARMDKTNGFLYGRTAFEAGQVDMWLDYVTNELDPSCNQIVQTVSSKGEPSLTEAEEAGLIEIITTALCGVESWLENRTFLVGERISIADIGLAFSLDWAFRFAVDHEVFTKKYKNVFRHYNTVMNQPQAIEVFKAHGYPIGLPEPEQKKEKKIVKKEGAEGDEDRFSFNEAKRAPNPLDVLPPSQFNLGAFKREYSKKDRRKEAVPYLFQNFDKEGWTCFWCQYKYNEELTKTLMTSNLIRGWFQRMEHVRKYGFGSVLILGQEGNQEIQGFFLFRGKGLPEIVSDVEDVELYTWTEISDVNKEVKKITDFLAWEGTSFAHNPVLEGRVFT